MDDIQKSILKNLKSGDYYNDALEWYSFNYVYPAAQRIFVGILLLLVLTACSILYSTYSQGVFGVENYFYIATVRDETKQKLRLIELDHPVSEQLSVAEFLIKKYVKKYETYDSATLAQQIEYIRRNSSKSVMKDFFRQMQQRDSDKVGQYGDFIKIQPEEVKVRFLLDQKNNAEEAEVAVTLIKTDYAKQEQTKISKKVFVRFELTNIHDIIEYQKPLIFQVNEYRIMDK